jgi:hypothetical protein
VTLSAWNGMRPGIATSMRIEPIANSAQLIHDEPDDPKNRGVAESMRDDLIDGLVVDTDEGTASSSTGAVMAKYR